MSIQLRFSTLCGFLVVRRDQACSGCSRIATFQYPLRVLGCEKNRIGKGHNDFEVFQYPLRVLGCEKLVLGNTISYLPDVSVPSAGSWL